MLIGLLSRAAVAVTYLAGLLFGGRVDLLAAAVAAAAIVAWIARPLITGLNGVGDRSQVDFSSTK